MFYEFQLVCAGHLPPEEPVTAATVCESCVCVCAGRRLCVQQAGAEQLTVLTFEQELDAVACWRGEAEWLAAAADRSGCVHVVSPRLETVTQSLLVLQPSTQPVFSALKPVEDSSSSLCLLALTLSGSLHVIHSTADCGEEKVLSIDLSLDHRPTAVCSIPNMPLILTLGREAQPLTVWRLEKQPPSLSVALQVSAPLSGGSPVVQVESTADSSYIVVLTEQGEVSVWLAEVMIMVGVWGGRRGQPSVSQFSLSSCPALQQSNLCALCTGSDQSKGVLVVLSVPGLQQLFCTQVSPSSVLASSPAGKGAACLCQPDSSNSSHSWIVELLEYGSPQDRVAVLVSEGKFEEAERLVQEFNLDPEVVLCKKTVALNGLVCAGKEDMLQTFLHCLRQIKDKDAAANLVLDSSYPSLAITHSVLSTLCSELTGCYSSSARAALSALNRLTTFHLISSGERFRDDWPTFLKGSALELVAYLLSANQLCHARLFWTRHQQAVEEELRQADCDCLLQLVPHDLPSLPSWLSATLLPFFLAHSPHQMTEFLCGLSSVLCSMEESDQDNWPRNTLSVVDQLLLSLSHLHPTPDLSPLTQLQRKLQNLSSVPASLRHNLSFATYEQFTPTQLLYRALDRALHHEDTRQLIAGPLSVFASNQQLSLDSLLAKYLQLFLARAPTHSTDFPGSPWEAKALAVIEGVASSEVRVSCCLDLLHSICTPWSSPVSSLVTSCLPLTTPSTQQLQILYNLLQMQMVLQEKYEIADFNFSDRSTGDVYIRQILVQQKSNVLSDALWVATKYGIAHSRVYIRHLFGLCRETRVEEAREVMCSLPPKTLPSTVWAALSFSLSRLNMPFVPGKSDPASHTGAARLALLCKQLSPPGCVFGVAGNCSAHLLQRVLELAEELSVFVSPNQLSSPHHTAQLLHENISNIPSTGCNVFRLGHLLGYSEHEVTCELVKLHRAMSLSVLKNCPAELTLSLLQSALTGSDLTFLTPSRVQELRCLSTLVSSSCPSRKLRAALLVFKTYCLLCDLMSVCVSEERAVWPWAARQREQGLQLEINSPFLQLAQALLQPSLHKSREQHQAVDLLQSTGHFNLAHHTAVECKLRLGVDTNLNSLHSSMLEKVLSMSKVDHSLGLALLLSTPPATALQLLHTKQSSIVSSYSRVIAFCTLTADYSHLVGLPQVRRTAVSLLTAAVWGKTLRAYKVNFWDAFRGGSEEKRRVMSQILHPKDFPHRLLLAYCRTYSLDGAGAMLTRLRLVLSEWDTDFQKGFAANLVPVRRHPYIPSLLTTFLTTKVCPYDYERIQYVLKELELRGATHPQHDKLQLLLSLLADYEERQPASLEEKSWHAAHCHGVCRAGKDFSPKRLPLHIFLNPTLGVQLISREVTSLSAVERFLAITQLMDIPDRKLYHTILLSLNTSKMTFDVLSPLLASIPDVETRLDITMELATSLSGREQVAMLEWAVELASEAPHLSSSLEHQLRNARTAVLLQEAGLERHITSVDSSSVISTLYTELPMLQGDTPAPKTVHRIAHCIADIHNINILAFTSQLLQEWLFPPKVGRQDLNTTLVKEMEEAGNTKDSSSLDNWTRMVYLLADNPHLDHLAGVLCNWTKTNSAMVGLSTRQCALQLLLTAVPPSVVDRVSGGNITQLRDKMQEAVFVTELASVQVALKPEVFQACKKSSIVASLVHNRKDSPKALRLAAEICLHYHLLDSELLNQLLAALLALKMIEFLCDLLPKLVVLGAHYTVPTLSSVWQRAVEASYETGVANDCLPALHLLYQCPVLFQLDLPAVAQTMTGAGAHSHALSVCLLLPSPQQCSTVDLVLSGFAAENLPRLLEEVTTSTCSELLLVADEVYRYVNRRGLHESLLGTAFFPHLVQFLITHRLLSSLLSTIISRGRVSEAAQLVEMYHNQHKVAAPTGVEGLKAYLKSQGLDIELCVHESFTESY